MDKTIPICDRDGFPLVNIGGKEHCSAEYLDRCIGSRRIVDVELREEGLFYLFENGHEFPLLCVCCEEPLRCQDIAALRQAIIGRKLQAMVWDIDTLEDGQEVVAFGLELSMLEGEEEPLIVSTSLKSAQEMIHPKYCGNLVQEESAKKRRKKPRKPRSRGRRRSRSS